MLRATAVASVLLSGPAWLVPAAAAGAAGQELARGTVVERVVCQGDAAQSYALYLPAGYSPARRWPILYALDPGARGERPVQRFKDAAEALGFIVAGSNNSRNGPLEVSDRALLALVVDTTARFSLDPRRVYLTGFSGGARTAVMAGLGMRDPVAGVIGFGAGFPPPLAPTAAMPFAYFGGIGTDDFNYPEMTALDDALGRLKLPHRVEVFDGGHEWPPATVCAHALEWMEIQAMRRDLRPRDGALVGRLFEKAMSEASSQEQAQPYLALLRYRAVAEDFRGLHDVAACEERGRAIERLPESEETRKTLDASIARQRDLELRVQRLIAGALGDDDPLGSSMELRTEMSRLTRQSQADRRPGDRMAARRVLTSTWILLREQSADAVRHGDLSRAAACLGLVAQVRPDDPQAEYAHARLLARGGDRKGAVAALRRAVAKGFADAPALQNDPDLEVLRSDPSFVDLVRKLAESPRR